MIRWTSNLRLRRRLPLSFRLASQKMRAEAPYRKRQAIESAVDSPSLFSKPRPCSFDLRCESRPRILPPTVCYVERKADAKHLVAPKSAENLDVRVPLFA